MLLSLYLSCICNYIGKVYVNNNKTYYTNSRNVYKFAQDCCTCNFYPCICYICAVMFLHVKSIITRKKERYIYLLLCAVFVRLLYVLHLIFCSGDTFLLLQLKAKHITYMYTVLTHLVLCLLFVFVLRKVCM